MRIICLTQVYKVIMCINTYQYQAISSPSIDRGGVTHSCLTILIVIIET